MELLLVFIGGLLGSSHCVGMCGGFAMSIGAGASGVWTNFERQLFYSFGRICTYSFAGAMVGFGGWRLAQSLPLVRIQAALAIFAGVLLIVQGLYAAGILRKRASGLKLPCAAPMFKAALTARHRGSLFLAGIMTGFLPCGLVYGFLALAGSTGSLWNGAAHMALFGLGTVPLMVATGLGGTLLQVGARRRVLQAAGWCVIVAGLMSCYRGYYAMPWNAEVAHAGCPFCR